MNNPAPSLALQQLPSLATALIAFQASVPTIHDNDKSFHGKFANLPGILSTIGPALRLNGLAVLQLPEDINGQPGLRTTLIHVSGEHVSAVTPLSINSGKNGTQEWGKAVTYSRRYALQAVLGLCVGIEDNDADIEPTISSTPAKNPKTASKVEGVSNSDQPLSENDRNLCLGLIKELTPEGLESFCAAFRRDFGLSKTAKVAPCIVSVKHQDWMNANLVKFAVNV